MQLTVTPCGCVTAVVCSTTCRPCHVLSVQQPHLSNPALFSRCRGVVCGANGVEKRRDVLDLSVLPAISVNIGP